MSKRKYEKGKKLQTGEAITSILKGRFIYYRDKVYSCGWTQNWSVHIIRQYARQGNLFEAILIKEKEKDNR